MNEIHKALHRLATATVQTIDRFCFTGSGEQVDAILLCVIPQLQQAGAADTASRTVDDPLHGRIIRVVFDQTQVCDEVPHLRTFKEGVS